MLLLPGVGAQGARPGDLARAFTSGPASALVSASRSVIYAYRSGGDDWRTAAAGEAARLRAEVWSVVRLVSPGNRSSLARFGAPAAFLLAATIAILLVRSATSHTEASTPPRANLPRTTSTAAERPPPPPTTAPGATVPADAEFYEIESGDTLAVVADRFDTTVERLLVLNPDVDPVALRVGQRIRVK